MRGDIAGTQTPPRPRRLDVAIAELRIDIQAGSAPH
jgi:hypothetical protein